MNIAIVEDHPSEAIRLAGLVEEYAAQARVPVSVRTFHGAEALLEGYRPHACTAIFLDIYLDGMDGVSAARKLRAMDRGAVLIFLTSSDEHMPEAFSVHAFDYILNGILPLVVIVTFIAYCASLHAPFCKSVAVYMLVFAFVGFFSNFANLFDAALHSASSPDDFSLAASVFQALLITAAVALVYYPVRKYGSAVVDQLDMPRVWYLTLPVSGVFIAYNLLHVPKTYASLYVDSGMPVFLISLLLLLILLCLLIVYTLRMHHLDSILASVDRESKIRMGVPKTGDIKTGVS